MTQMIRFGQKSGDCAASFRCAACGEVAAVVKAAPAGAAIDMGPPLGPQTHRHPGIVVDAFGGTAWKLAGASDYAAVRAVLASASPDPAELRRIGWELAPFFCPDCGQNYCRADWRPRVHFDEIFYDCTMGVCPAGHEYMIED
jgi:predicted RNA-binding Zn-ribbon protein involved in translation (DUF1610 family)